MRNESGHNYRNNLVIVDLAMGQIRHSTEPISSFSDNIQVSTLNELLLHMTRVIFFGKMWVALKQPVDYSDFLK